MSEKRFECEDTDCVFSHLLHELFDENKRLQDENEQLKNRLNDGKMGNG